MHPKIRDETGKAQGTNAEGARILDRSFGLLVVRKENQNISRKISLSING